MIPSVMIINFSVCNYITTTLIVSLLINEGLEIRVLMEDQFWSVFFFGELLGFQYGDILVP